MAAALLVLGGCGVSDSKGASALGPAASGKIYLVQLANGVDVDSTLDDLHRAHGLGIAQRYHHALHGGALLISNAVMMLPLAAAGLRPGNPSLISLNLAAAVTP